MYVRNKNNLINCYRYFLLKRKTLQASSRFLGCFQDPRHSCHYSLWPQQGSKESPKCAEPTEEPLGKDHSGNLSVRTDCHKMYEQNLPPKGSNVKYKKFQESVLLPLLACIWKWFPNRKISVLQKCRIYQNNIFFKKMARTTIGSPLLGINSNTWITFCKKNHFNSVPLM